MNPPTPPTAFLAISNQCPHCQSVLAGLVELVKQGRIGRLEIMNIQAQAEQAREMGIRSVPWIRIGPFELTGAHSPAELATWVDRAGEPQGLADAFHDLLKQGRLSQVLVMIRQDPSRLAAVLPILANPEASINVRLGAGAVFEEYAGTAALASLVPALVGLAGHGDARIRADACYCLGLSRHESARQALTSGLKDMDGEVREIAAEALEALELHH